MKHLLAGLIALLVSSMPGEPVAVDFATLSGFDYEEGKELPAAVTRYDGEDVEISGFMQSEDGETEDVEFFMLVNESCNCEGEPRLNEIVFCEMPVGETTSIRAGTVEVTGTLWVGEEVDDGMVLGIYFMEVDSID